LKRSQRLSSIALLDTDMNIRLLGAIGLLKVVVLGVKGIGCGVIQSSAPAVALTEQEMGHTLVCDVLDAHTMSIDPTRLQLGFTGSESTNKGRSGLGMSPPWPNTAKFLLHFRDPLSFFGNEQ
jgi:hypothetical protein